MVIGNTFFKRSMAVFAFVLSIGAFDSHDYTPGLVLCFAFAVALCEPTYWFTQTMLRRCLAFVFLVLLAGELGVIHWGFGA